MALFDELRLPPSLPLSLSLSPPSLCPVGARFDSQQGEAVTRSFSILGEHIHRWRGGQRRQEDGAARGSQGSVRRQRGKRGRENGEALEGTEHG